MNQEKKEKKNSPVWLRFSSLGIQMGLTIYFAHLIGVWLDKNHSSTSFSYDKVFTLLAVFGSTYSIIRQVIKMQNDEESSNKKQK
jgi:NO-binding membrane sensor protein with MHYT domain